MVTLKDVAKYANVSIATVSRILREDDTLNVSLETRTKVQEAVAKLNYVPKPRKNSNQNIKLVVAIIQCYTYEQEIRDTYYITLLQSVEKYLKTHHIAMRRVREGDIDVESVLQNVHGIICIGKISSFHLEKLCEMTENIIFLDMDMSPITECCITLDFDDAMYQVVKYFHDLGHKKIGFLGRSEYNELNHHIQTRKRSFIKYCQEFHMEYQEFSLEKDLTSEAGYNLVYEMAQIQKLPSALFAVNDPIAIGAMRALQDLNIRVPQDVSIIGFNNIDAGNFTSPSLSTVYAPADEMGELGASLLHQSLLNGKKLNSMRIQLPCYLIERNSSIMYHED